MKLLVCFFLLLLNFASVSGREIEMYFVNYSDKECVLMNQVCGSSLWSAETEKWVTLTTRDEQTPTVLQPREKFRGFLDLPKEPLQDDDVFLIKLEESIFKLRFDHGYDTIPYLCNGNEQRATKCTNYKGVELNYKYRYIIQDNIFRVTQIEAWRVYFFLINNSDKAPEGDLTVPSGNDFEDQRRYEREFGDMYGKIPTSYMKLSWSDPVLPTSDPGLPKKKRCGCIIL